MDDVISKSWSLFYNKHLCLDFLNYKMFAMKTIVQTLFVFVALILLPYYGFSQSGYEGATDMDVDSVYIGGTYTQAQIQAKWGTPTKYRSNTSEFGLNETYTYI